MSPSKQFGLHSQSPDQGSRRPPRPHRVVTSGTYRTAPSLISFRASGHFSFFRNTGNTGVLRHDFPPRAEQRAIFRRTPLWRIFMPVPYAPKHAVPRIVGVDVARGLALLGMFSVHAFGAFDAAGAVTPAWMFAGGRSSATFAVTAGIGLAFTTGGRPPATGRPAAGAVGARAGGIALIGPLLGYASPAAGPELGAILGVYPPLFPV